MAQWNGQFTGNSHATKVEDCENMLKHAVDALQSCTEEQKPAKIKSVRNLAGKVLNARLKMARAKRYEADPVESDDSKARRIQLEHLTELETKLTRASVAGILIEFGAAELANAN